MPAATVTISADKDAIARNLHAAWYLGGEETTQERFDRLYITSSEICRDLGVTRPSILQARRRNLLPEPITLHGCLYIWERAAVAPYVDAWRIILNARRSNTPAPRTA